MARQEDTCWNCGAAWDYRLATRSPLRVIPGRAAERTASDRARLSKLAEDLHPIRVDVVEVADQVGA